MAATTTTTATATIPPVDDDDNDNSYTGNDDDGANVPQGEGYKFFELLLSKIFPIGSTFWF